LCVAQLRVDGEHAAAEDFGAAANGGAGFGEEGGASAEEHAAVRREAVIVEIFLESKIMRLRGLSSAATF